MNQEPVNGKEFIAIMVAAGMIMIPLLCNPQYVSKHPVYLGQAAGIQMGSGDRPMDFSHGDYRAADQWNTQQVQQPFSATRGSGYGTWSCSIGNAFSSGVSWVGNMFGGMGRYLMQEKAY